MPTRHGGEATLAFWSAASGVGHSRRGAGYVEAYQLRDVKSGLAFLPLGSCGLHVLALLLAGVQGFFQRYARMRTAWDSSCGKANSLYQALETRCERS